ncbi:hypothetical protein ILYODFUR_015579 [Ilyodon furcidens]|uniref:Uncharacterized protein n=1 Tax=Ilyodon furcidens TaxID=33524 RepID=A0ABV0UVP0_9TELE
MSKGDFSDEICRPILPNRATQSSVQYTFVTRTMRMCPTVGLNSKNMLNTGVKCPAKLFKPLEPFHTLLHYNKIGILFDCPTQSGGELVSEQKLILFEHLFVQKEKSEKFEVHMY